LDDKFCYTICILIFSNIMQFKNMYIHKYCYILFENSCNSFKKLQDWFTFVF